ncbi:MAG: GNAT family N-acetyltransferase [Proteocatella sp.]
MNFIVENNRIYMEDESEKLLAEVTFETIDDNTVEIDHTFVDSSLSGKGIASELINMLALKLRSENKKAVPTCSYAVKWFEKHTEFKDILE